MFLFLFFDLVLVLVLVLVLSLVGFFFFLVDICPVLIFPPPSFFSLTSALFPLPIFFLPQHVFQS